MPSRETASATHQFTGTLRFQAGARGPSGAGGRDAREYIDARVVCHGVFTQEWAKRTTRWHSTPLSWRDRVVLQTPKEQVGGVQTL